MKIILISAALAALLAMAVVLGLSPSSSHPGLPGPGSYIQVPDGARPGDGHYLPVDPRRFP